MKQILAFGDSNTWGLIPGTMDRYPEYTRWTGILRRIITPKGYRILEDGVVGRTTVFEDPARPFRKGIDSIARYRRTEDLAAVILMLGTNDCKKTLRNTPEQIGDGIEQCISRFEEFVSPGKILVLSPILLGENVWRPDKDPAFDRESVETSTALKEIYQAIAARRGNLFMAASDYAVPSPVDEEHLSIEGHVYLASAILKKLTDSGLL
ncbi:MAG: arylesterase [Clostridia bacterium]|nr:arylesterase [Clostridia bacterium]